MTNEQTVTTQILEEGIVILVDPMPTTHRTYLAMHELAIQNPNKIVKAEGFRTGMTWVSDLDRWMIHYPDGTVKTWFLMHEDRFQEVVQTEMDQERERTDVQIQDKNDYHANALEMASHAITMDPDPVFVEGYRTGLSFDQDREMWTVHHPNGDLAPYGVVSGDLALEQVAKTMEREDDEREDAQKDQEIYLDFHHQGTQYEFHVINQASSGRGILYDEEWNEIQSYGFRLDERTALALATTWLTAYAKGVDMGKFQFRGEFRKFLGMNYIPDND